MTFTYDTNTLYKVTETVPPGGYRLPDEVKTFYFYFSSTEDTAHTLPDNLPSDAVDLTNEARTVYVENVKNTTEISVEKKWLDENGNDETASHSGEEIELGLYQRVGLGSSSVTGDGNSYNFTVKRNGTILTDEPKPSGTVAHLSFTDTWGKDYTSLGVVTVNGEEVTCTKTVNGNAATYSLDIVINQDTTVVINFSNELNWTDYNPDYAEPSAPTDPGDDDAVTEGTCLQTITLNRGNNWTATISDLLLADTAEDGTTKYYYYYFKEVNVPDGYSVSYSDGQSGVQSGTITVTNRKNKAVISVTVDKVWKDVNGEDVEGTSATLPDSIQVYLKRTAGETTERVDSDGNTGDSAKPYTLTRENGWTLTVGNLPKTDSDGNAYSYSFEEVPVEGYETTVAKVGEGSFTITNKKQPAETDLTVKKVWQDKDGNTVDHNGGSVTIKLYQKAVSGSSSGGDSGGNTGGSEGGSSVTLSGEIKLRGEDGSVWRTIESVSKPVGTTVTIGISDFYYDANRTPPVLTANGVTQTASSTEDESWKSSWGSTYTKRTYYYSFTLQEDTVIGGYTGNHTASDWELIGPIYEEPSTTINPGSGNGESTVTEVILYQTVTLSKDNDWAYTFTNLPLTGTDGDGNAVTYYYYIEEVSVPNYDTSYDNNGGIQSGTITVTNKAKETPEYQLPETGGSGTIWYALGGMLLIVSAVILLVYNHSKRRKEDSASF